MVVSGARAWALVAWVALGLTACIESDAPSAPPLPDASRSEFPCEPACAPAYACDDGTCVPACDPACPEGTTCQLDGTCDSLLDDGPGADFERNSCGGFGELEGTPGTACGPCGTGIWLCETEDRVDCADPEGLNACGVCGSLPGVPGQVCDDEMRYACTPDGELPCVPWFDANPCLGTVDLGEAQPGRPCGACDRGYYVCDGNNATTCFEPEDNDEPCGCEPGDPPVPCNTDAGLCERGVRFCQDDGTYGACVIADMGETCVEDADCPDPRQVCVRERFGPEESLDDTCVDGDEAACTRSVCRHPATGAPCTRDDECRATSVCADGECRPMVTRPTQEYCNGIDDDCDGKIDNDDRRTEICGACPYNMMLFVNAGREFGRRRICVDIYEASRPDATADDPGTDDRRSTSRWDVMPWIGATPEEAVAACAGAGYNALIPGGVPEKRLCVVDEWPIACNLEGYTYPYGDTFRPGACNDAERGSALPTSSLSDCAYTPPGGNFPNYDFSGNVQEWVRGEDGVLLAGGAFHDSDPDALTCGSVRTPEGQDPSTIGFRCCAATISVTEFEE